MQSVAEDEERGQRAAASPGDRPASAVAAAAAAEQAPPHRGGSYIWDEAQESVVLNVEYMSNRTTRLLLFQFRFALAVATAILVWETCVKFTHPGTDLVEFDSLVAANVAIASTCLAASLAVGGLLVWRVRAVNRAGRRWAPLRKRTVAVFGAELAVQCVNLVFYLAPNAFVLTKSCAWFLTPVHVSSVVRWTCWNTLFCLFVVQAHSPLPAQLSGPTLWRAALASAAQRVRTGLARVGGAARQGVEKGWGVAVHRAQRQAAHTLSGAPGEAAAAADAADAAAAMEAARRAGARPAANGGQHGAADEERRKAEAAPQEVEAAPAPAVKSLDAAWVAATHPPRSPFMSEMAHASVGGGKGGDTAQPPAAAAAAADDEQGLVMEKPLKLHYWKALLLWLPCQVVVILLVLYLYGVIGGHQAPCSSLDDLRCYPQAVNGTANCSEWSFNCGAFSGEGGVVIFAVLISALCMFTLGVYFLLLAFAQRQLARRPYMLYRHNNVLLRVQYQTRLIAAAFFFVCNTLFWYVSQQNCTSYILTWLGLTPMQIVMTSLAILNTWSVLPSDPGRRQRDLHVWLQDFAWLEEDVARKVELRPIRHSEPLFCVETALKLLCFSWVVYDDSHDDDEEEEEEEEEEEDVIEEASLHGGGTAAGRACSVGGGGRTDGGGGDGSPGLDDIAAGTPPLPGFDAAAAGSTDKPARAPPPPLPTDAPPPAAAGAAASRGSGSGGSRSTAEAGPVEELGLGTALGLYRLTRHTVLYGPQHDAKCLIGWSEEEGVAVVAFRGTCSLTNMLNNLKVWRTAHPPVRGSYWLCRRPMVHRGFQQSWEDGLNLEVMATLRGILTASPPPGGRRPWRLLFTGHSLGGALASLAAYDAVQLLSTLPVGCCVDASQVHCYTFGAPRPGNHAFARDYRATVPNSFDVIHADDTITRNGKFLVLYKRAAHRVVLSPSGDLLVRPSLIERSAREPFQTSLQQHVLGAYGRSLAGILRGQLLPAKEFNGGRRGCAALLRCQYVQAVLRATAQMRQESLAAFHIQHSRRVSLEREQQQQERRQGERRQGGAAAQHEARPPRGASVRRRERATRDQHLASGAALTPHQRRGSASAAAQLSVRRLSGRASWQLPPLGPLHEGDLPEAALSWSPGATRSQHLSLPLERVTSA
ncbi:alpha beta-hydrolase [Micractinium conductrix]|uniref:Alpha beta-hydrolase n=1 Tax=Micractinium conductrix TaxID=554055 RepID=A0A2P6VN15_9CHLO|nr:alpha beta-hydrolase [Micractinium conductrix]|eukprot:PSC75484.1 alpha beta-hydrolase [Micractinium conductrix]